jgi:hypothetical protein
MLHVDGLVISVLPTTRDQRQIHHSDLTGKRKHHLKIGRLTSSHHGVIALLISACLTSASNACAQKGLAPFKLTIATDIGPFTAGGNVFLKVIQTNTSDSVIDCGGVNTNGIDLAYTYWVWDPNGHPLEPKYNLWDSPITSAGQCELKPRSSIAREELISELYDMRKPGRYRVEVFRWTHVSNPKVVVSNDLVIDLTE